MACIQRRIFRGAVEEVVKLKIGALVTQFNFPSVMRKIEKKRNSLNKTFQPICHIN